jgi:K(+)-stimulated pyrophosphate-energized sodium pump
VTGLFLGHLDDLGRRRLGQRKKLIEDGAYGGKGSEATRLGHRRHGRRSLQGHRRPAINPMIKITNIVAILIIPIIVKLV